MTLWRRYFNGAELPLAFYYTDDETGAPLVKPGKGHRCLVAQLARVRAGTPKRFGVDSIGCPGGRRYCGFSYELRSNFRYFLSCGIPGEMEGERYKKTPELADEVMAAAPRFEAPGKFIVFKRLDQLEDTEKPDVIVFFGTPDVLAGLFTLANFDRAQDGVIAPFGAGCSSIVQHPFLEGRSDKARCVLGCFDPSARPFVPGNALSFAVPADRFYAMVENIPESFLTTPTWGKIRRRISRAGD